MNLPVASIGRPKIVTRQSLCRGKRAGRRKLDARDDERYAPARHADVVPAYRPGAPSHDSQFEPPATGQFSAPALRYNGVRELARDYAAPEQPRYRDEQEPPDALRPPAAAFPPRLPADEYAYDDQAQDGADDQAYALEDYEEEAPQRPPAERICRRSGRARVGGARNRGRVCVSRDVWKFDAAVAAADHQGGRRTEQDRAQA